MEGKYAEADIFLHHADDALIHHAYDLYRLRDRLDVKLVDTRANRKQDFEIAVPGNVLWYRPGDEVTDCVGIDS
ncbi:hypothetical protein D3C87_1984720 [compost metagenome]